MQSISEYLPGNLGYKPKVVEKATPFVKWVGGKRSLMSDLLSRLPKTINNYYEPFVGGGALFFEIAKKAKNVFLSDTNKDLIVTYNVIKNSLDQLLPVLKKHQKNHSTTYYYDLRSNQRLKNPIQIAARFIYLNKTCFNGLYRVNKRGEFNVPVGRYKKPNIANIDNLFAVAKALQGVGISCMDFSDITPKKGDFVYFDPPYHPLNSKSFTSYTAQNFSQEDQTRLRNFCIDLSSCGVNLMISNSNVDLIRSLYGTPPFNMHTVSAPRFVNCKSTKRGAVEELLITNY